MPITMLDNNASISITEEGDGLMKDVRFTQSNFLYHHKIDDPIDAHYTFGDLLGEGGFGVVYKGTHKKTGTERAIKRMEKDPRDRELNEEIIREFDFLKELDHPNLIKVYDMFEGQ
jgi:calcium-dependent protein kinase